VLFAFDLLEYDGEDLRDLPLIERRRLAQPPNPDMSRRMSQKEKAARRRLLNPDNRGSGGRQCWL
jgi:ATP-dependent DNA ligase